MLKQREGVASMLGNVAGVREADRPWRVSGGGRVSLPVALVTPGCDPPRSRCCLLVSLHSTLPASLPPPTPYCTPVILWAHRRSALPYCGFI